MKVNDYGGDNISLKEKSNGCISPHEIEAQLELINRKMINNSYTIEKREEDSKKLKTNQIKGKVKEYNEKKDIDEFKIIKPNINSKNKFNNNNNSIKNDFNKSNNKNCINNIDFDKNIITINKQNLKELNNINKEIKIEKKNELTSKKGEIINIYVNEKFNYNKDISNLIKTSFEYIAGNNFYSSFEDYEQIKSNSLFPNEIIKKFLEKKSNKNKEKNDYNYFSSFGNNPLQTLKDIQNNLIEQYSSQKNNKMNIKQFKTNQKYLKEQNILLQNYIKTLPVLNCPESKIFKLNQYYLFNKIIDDKNINIINKVCHKNIKSNNYYNNNKEKEESEEETIDRHIKKKFINKKRNSSIDKK
jgi:hypothetical protein